MSTCTDAQSHAATAVADVAAIRTLMSALGERVGDAVRWSAEDRRAVLDGLDRAVDGLSALRARVLVAERESGTWEGAGDRSFQAWRGRTSRSGQRSATAQVRQADQLAAVPAVAAAVTAGRIGLEHAAAIARVASTGTPTQRDALAHEAGQDELLALAERVDAGTFSTAVARWAAGVDPSALERDHEAQRRERYLHVVHTPRGTMIKGQVDSMAGHTLTLALEAVTPRPTADDDRDAGQRRADALQTMASRILSLSDTRPGGHVPPQVSMILTAETWAAARAERDRRRSDADHAPREAASASSHRAPASLEDGTPVPDSVLAAAMCDCEITRIVIDAAGVPLDLGRTERLFTGAQRRAVIARDRECAWTDCHAHARWCEIHHALWWDRDAGPTSVDNGVLLCTFHHHEVHRRDVVITRIHEAGAGARAASGHRVALARYEFRDRAGRLVAGAPPHPPDRRQLPHTPAPPEPTHPPDSTHLSQRRARDAEQPAPTAVAPRGVSPGRAPAEDVDIAWVDDPFTGARMPSFLLT